MMMSGLTDLNELDLPREVINHLLVARVIPPFDRYVIFPACGDNPKGRILAGKLTDYTGQLVV